MSQEILKGVLESDLVKEIKDETIEELLQTKKEIEESKEINGFQKGWKKLFIDIKLKLLGYKDEDKDEDPTTKEEGTQTTTQNENREAYDPSKPLLFAQKIQENKTAFIKRVKEIGQTLAINPNRLMQIMNKESGLNEKAVNKDTQATGLIQCMPETAKGLGTTVQKLKNMTNVEQLDYVVKYYEQYKDKIHTHTDLYLATFYPAALGKPDSYVIGSENGKEAIIGKQNNMNNGNPITVAHVKDWISKDIPTEYLAQFQGTAPSEDTSVA